MKAFPFAIAMIALGGLSVAQSPQATPPAPEVCPEAPATPAAPAKVPVSQVTVPAAASAAITRFNEAQREVNAFVVKLCKEQPELDAARKASMELTRDAMKAAGSHPELAELRKKRDDAVNRLGNALKGGDKAAASAADAEVRTINKELDAKAATLPDLVEKKEKAKAARVKFVELKDAALDASPEGKALKAKVEEAKSAIAKDAAAAVQAPSAPATPAPAKEK